MGIIYKNGIAYGDQPNGTVPSGGTTGQVLKKASNTDYDTEWANESGGGGTSDYTQLSNKPQINGNTLTGNQTGAQLGLVDAVTGKQLSTEDYTTAEKTKLAGIEAQANKTVIDDTLTNTGEAADAKAVGDEISDVRNTLTQLETDTFGNINLTGTNNTGSTITTGTFFYNNGALVRAKTAIQNGSAITIGTNAETVTAGGLNAINTSMTIISTSLASNKVFVAKCAGIVTVYVAGYSGSGNVTIATLPEEYLPWHGLNVFVSTAGGAKVDLLEVGVDGKLRMYNLTSTDVWYGTISYVASKL